MIPIDELDDGTGRVRPASGAFRTARPSLWTNGSDGPQQEIWKPPDSGDIRTREIDQQT